jgi:hypothetical protein
MMNRLMTKQQEAPPEATVDPVLEQQKRLNENLEKLISTLQKN